MSSTFTTTGSASNLTRLELEQLRKSDAFANGRALTIGDSGLAPEGVVGIGSVTAEPYFSGPQVALADLLSAKVPGQPGIGVGHDTLFPTTPTLGGGSTATVGDAPFWYGPTQIAVGTTGAATAINQWSDAAGEFVLAGPGYDVQPGDYLVINRRSTVVGDLNDAAVGTVSVVAAGLLTLTDIWNPSNIGLETELDPTNGDLFTYSVIRPGAVQLFAVPGSGPVGQEQTFLFVQPASTLHSNPSPSLGAINADRLTSIVSPRFASAPTVDRSDSIYGSPAPRTALDQLGYRVVFYPDDGAGNPDFTAPIASLNPLIDPAIPAADQRVTIDYTSGVVRFSCAPALTGDIKVAGGVDGTTGRLNLYATFFSYRNTVASSAAAQKLFVTRSSTQTTELPARMVWDEANATWVFHTPNPVRLASATSPQLRQMDGTNSNISIVQRVNSIGVSVGDGTTSFGDFNGTNAIAQVLAYWGLAGTQSLRVHVKRGAYTVTALDVPAGLELILQGDGRQDTELTLAPSGPNAFSVATGAQLVLEDLALLGTDAIGVSLGSIRGKRCLFEGALPQFGMGNSYRGASSGLRVLSAHFEDTEFSNAAGSISPLNFISTPGTKSGFLFEECTIQSPSSGAPAITAGVITPGVASFTGVTFSKCNFLLHGVASTSATYTSAPTGLLYLDPSGGTDLNLSISDWAFRHCDVTVADEVVDNKILLHLLPIAYNATDLTLRARIGKFTIEGGTWSVPTTQGTDFAPFFLMAEHPVIKDFSFTGCGTVYGTFQTAPEYRGNGYWSNPMKLALNNDVAMPPVPQRETAFSVIASGMGLLTDPNLNGLTIRNLRLSHFHRASRSGELFLQGPDLKGNAIDVDGITLSDYSVGVAETTTPFSRVTIRPGGNLTSHRGTMGVYRNVHLNLQPTNVNTVDWTSSSLVNLSTEGDLQAENFVIEGWVSNTSDGCQVGRIGIDINNTWGSNPTVRGFVSLRNSRSLGMGTGVRVNGNPSGFDLDRVLVNMQASSAGGDPSYGIQVVPSTCPIYPSRISNCTITTNNLPAASTYQGVSVAITTWLAFNPLHVVDNSVFLSTVENAITADNRAFAILSADAGSVVSCIFRGNSGYANATVTSEVLRARLQRGNGAALTATAARGGGTAYVGVEIGNNDTNGQEFLYDSGYPMIYNSLIMETP
mgnify:CR=1 FL=1